MLCAEELKEHLDTQIQLLRGSCERFDNGVYKESIRIAGSLRILFHQTPKSFSLLHQLSAESAQLLSTIPPTSNKIGTGTALGFCNNLHLNVSTGEIAVKPWLEKAPDQNFVPYKKWWAEEVIMGNNEDKDDVIEVSRKDLVCWVANKDGASHIDVSPRKFIRLKNAFGLKLITTYPNGKVNSSAIPNIQFAALRQMAFEVLNSPDVLSLYVPILKKKPAIIWSFK